MRSLGFSHALTHNVFFSFFFFYLCSPLIALLKKRFRCWSLVLLVPRLVNGNLILVFRRCQTLWRFCKFTHAVMIFLQPILCLQLLYTGQLEFSELPE